MQYSNTFLNTNQQMRQNGRKFFKETEIGYWEPQHGIGNDH